MTDRERKSVRKPAKETDGEAAVLAKIAAMPAPYRAMGERLHAKDGKRVCFFRTDKYMTLGLTEEANLAREEGAPHRLLASAWYFTALDDPTDAKLSAIVREAAR